MPELLRMRFHPLASDVKCATCGGHLVFIRVRGFGDLYQCASDGPCRGQVIHYRKKTTKTCGYAVLHKWGAIGVWTVCDMPTAKE
jgi:hypothetical protein